MTEQELYNEYQKSDYKSFIDFLINKIADLEKENAELKARICKLTNGSKGNVIKCKCKRKTKEPLWDSDEVWTNYMNID